MLKACQYCGRIHDKRVACSAKRRTMAERDAIQRERSERNRSFRSSGVWRRKAAAIRKRDKDTCLVCLDELRRTYHHSGSLSGTEVHHITPLSDNFDLRLEDENLITLCRDHHEQAESGGLSADYLRALVSASISADR